MADDENNQPKKSRGILKILGFALGGLLLVGAGLGAWVFYVWKQSTRSVRRD
jgi:hypothetical protein